MLAVMVIVLHLKRIPSLQDVLTPTCALSWVTLLIEILKSLSVSQSGTDITVFVCHETKHFQ